MTTRDEIIALAVAHGANTAFEHFEQLETFFHAAQHRAYEHAAEVCETECGDCADVIRAIVVIDGFVCQMCMGVMHDHKSPGYPRTCRECKKSTNMHAHHHTNKVKCPICGKKVKEVGLADHQRDSHGVLK